MKKDQKKIYYFLAPSKEFAMQSPFMDQFIHNEIPVLFLQVNVEEMTFQDIGNYKGFEFQNIESQNC